jgi:HEPN domain-containing protein
MAGVAVSLAARILDEQGADEEQLRYLHAAREYLAAASEALDAGDDRRAIHLASHALWSSLKALVLPGGVSMEEARAMADLAEDLYLKAVAAVGEDPTDLQAALLRRARHFIDVGLEKLAEEYPRGVGALWRAAVISAWLAG